MGRWPGKYVIGLTGNIATGKSVIRRMLEHLGAYGIDADALSHRAIAKGAPGYEPIVRLFGAYILDPDGQINRERLGRIVFADPRALAKLEAIVHPLVRQAIDLLVRRTGQKVIVIEAIKLLEGELRQACDAIWVTHANPYNQLERLVRKRKMERADARLRIDAQPPQTAKLAAADVVINNSGSIEDAWRQVVDAWQQTVPVAVEPEVETQAEAGELQVIKALPRHAEQIAAFLRTATRGARTPDRADIMEAFGEKAFLLLVQDEVTVGLAGWQVENLVARVNDFYVDGRLPLLPAAQALIGAVEQASSELQCEAALLFLPGELARAREVWAAVGYEKRSIDSLGVRAWQDAARESMPANTELFFHQLRKDRILRPV
jgi:dephospho-CoA kinase